MSSAKIYLRQNGEYGASYGNVPDTGHMIKKGTREFFTVWSIQDEDRRICVNAPRNEAEKAIAEDWRTAE